MVFVRYHSRRMKAVRWKIPKINLDASLNSVGTVPEPSYDTTLRCPITIFSTSEYNVRRHVSIAQIDPPG
jgi:hypothetical protein